MVLSVTTIGALNWGVALFALFNGQLDRAYEFFCFGNALIEASPLVEHMEYSDV